MKNNNLSDNIIYLNSSDNKYRYALGTKGANTLYCIGINPSTATPQKDDPAIKRVKKTAEKMGFDSFLMLNIYPQRATNPNNMEDEINQKEHKQSLLAFELIKDGASVWAAWGDSIHIRPYLKNCLNDIIDLLQRKNINYVKMGELTKRGNPRYPLFVKYQPFSEYKINHF